MFLYINDHFPYNYKIWEHKIINFVELLEQNKDCNKLKNKIKLWIIKNIYIAIKQQGNTEYYSNETKPRN